MHFSQLPIKATIFTHIDEKNGEQNVIWVDGLIEAVKKKIENKQLEVVSLVIDNEFAKWVLYNRGIEAHRLTRINYDNIFDPMIFLNWPDGSHLLVDGNHRYVRYWQLGIKEGLGILVTKNIWRNFIVTGLPHESERTLLTKFSGIL